MNKETAIKLFEEQKVRVEWDENQEKWYFSIVDVISILTQSPNPRKYWSVLKTRLKSEGSELTTNCSQLKMKAADGKMYLTDVADTEQLLRLIQSIPSPKAEPFKMWLAKVGRERIDEMAFYDALTKPQAVKDFYENEELVAITKELTDALRKNKTIDWQKREGARAKMRMLIKKLLKKHKYPPEGVEDAVQVVMTQCELWTDNVMEV